ncbi:hypothetical protein [Catenulispora yoronensis]
MTGRRGYFESEDAYVRRATEAATSAAADADARLAGQIRTTDGRINALAARVEGLSQAFDAFLDAAALRRECEQYWSAAAVRGFVRAHLGALSGRGGAVPAVGGVADVPGYWLPAAVRGLIALLGGGGGGGEGDGYGEGVQDSTAAELLAEATRRDAYRTAVFLVAVLGARGAGAEAEPWLRVALPKVADAAELTLATRCLWLAYGAGAYGPAGRAVLSEWLGGLTASVESGELEKALDALGGGSDPLPRQADDPRIRNLRSKAVEDSLRDAAVAGRSLATLYDALNGTPPRPTADAAAQDHDTPAPNPSLETLITALVEEGSTPEIELLRRAAELEARARRSALRDDSPQPVVWTMSVGLPAGVLLADLFDTAEAAAGRRTTALNALARPLATLADALLARTTELPTTLTVSIPWQPPIVLDHATPLAQTLATVHADIQRAVEADSPGSGRRQAEANRRRVEEQRQIASDRLGDAVEVLADYRRQGEEIHTGAKQAYDAVMSLLGSHAEGTL